MSSLLSSYRNQNCRGRGKHYGFDIIKFVYGLLLFQYIFKKLFKLLNHNLFNIYTGLHYMLINLFTGI